MFAETLFTVKIAGRLHVLKGLYGLSKASGVKLQRTYEQKCQNIATVNIDPVLPDLECYFKAKPRLIFMRH